MNPLDQVNEYLRHLERRLRLREVSQGAALIAAVALIATVGLALVTNAFAFSDFSMISARVVLFLAIAFALAFGIVLPLLRLNRRRTARRAEEAFPEFEQRLLTFAEAKREGQSDAFLELLADDAMPVVRQAEPERLVTAGRVAAFFGAAATAVGVLIWLTTAAPGFLGYGSSLLWAGHARGQQPFYDIRVSPGDQTVRRGGDQLITAQLVGLQTPDVRLYARYESTSKWEEVTMQPEPGGASFEFLFAGLPEAVDYYIQADAVRTRQFRLDVIDLPKVERIGVTYRYPEWLRKEDLTEPDGGDLRAVEGTTADLLVETDKPLEGGLLVLDDGTEISLSRQGSELARGSVDILNDGMYHVAVMHDGERVRLSEDYFIEAQRESAPEVRVRRPGRDYRASPIEEVTIAVEGSDDFGLNELSVRYSINGSEEKTAQLLKQRGATEADGSTILYLEDANLVPGDLISFYAVARDAKNTARSDIFFIEAQPYEREYSQSQISGGGMGGGGGQQDPRLSPRQKEIIAATWNLLQDESLTPAERAQDAEFLASQQEKLKEQAQSAARRMRARELSSVNDEFASFSESMEFASRAMSEVTDNLKNQRLRGALQPEQKALQHLLRAEATFRQIQVAQGRQGGGGGGGGNMSEDLQDLLELELDTEKNQYETGQQAASGGQSQEIDEALQRLQELARRQQELAEQQKQQPQTSEQRWQQEMLRREAEELRRQMEQLARQSSSRQQQGQRGQQQGQAGSQQGGIPGQVSEQRLDQAIERLRQATDDMRNANSARDNNRQRESEARRAAERLQEATEMLDRMRSQESSDQLSDIVERAARLSEQQKDFSDDLREMYRGHRALGGDDNSRPQPGETMQTPDPAEVAKLAERKRQMAEQLRGLERDMQSTVRDLSATEREAAARLREALGEMQQNELGLRMRYLSDWIQRGLGAYAWLREAPVTQGLERLAEQTRQAQNALGQSGSGDQQELEKALARVENLRRQMEEMTRQLREGEQGQRGQQGQQAGRQQGQGQPGQQPGQQQGQGQQGQGQQGQGQQPGPGQRGGSQSMGGMPSGGGGDGRSYSAMNTGERQFDASGRAPGEVDFGAIERSYREGMRDLSRLRRDVSGSGASSEEIDNLIREMQRLDPSRFPGNPELVDRLRTQVLTGLEQLELRLRRELAGEEGGDVKSVLSRPVPPGYDEAVANYYRRLSESRK